jgi:hypothetical protein
MITAWIDSEPNLRASGIMPKMVFEPDREFEGPAEAFRHIVEYYDLQPHERFWCPPSFRPDPIIPVDAPHYLFRGEGGIYETTTCSVSRPETYALKDGRFLSGSDRWKVGKLIDDLAQRFVDKQDYNLDRPRAYGLLQHYHLPTKIIDFTGTLQVAMAFAGSGTCDVARLAVMPMPRPSPGVIEVVNFTAHPWTMRPRWQTAFGVVPSGELIDLKSDVARSRLNINWCQFTVTDLDRQFLSKCSNELVNWSNDPSAGFPRFHITEYVEAYGKFSPELTEWLLERVPPAPYCYLIDGFDGEHIDTRFRSRDDLEAFDEDAERDRSRRYWSSAYVDRSADRLKNWAWPPVGSVVADPRTHHAPP